MSIRKITDGPWNVGSPDDNGHIAIVQPHPSHPEGRTGYIVAKVTYATETPNNEDAEPTDESKAIANLVAAAPDLLRVAKLIAFTPEGLTTDSKAYELLKAAIAKAEATPKFTRDNPRCPVSETGWSQNAKCIRRCTKHKNHEGNHTFGNWSLA